MSYSFERFCSEHPVDPQCASGAVRRAVGGWVRWWMERPSKLVVVVCAVVLVLVVVLRNWRR